MKININIPENLANSLTRRQRAAAKFITIQESDGDLSKIRMGQEFATNLVPKSLFARGLVDLFDNGFREGLEIIIVYLGPKFLGEKLFRKLYSKKLSAPLKELVSKPAHELINEKNINKDKLIPVKTAIAVSALAIPFAEYALSYAKNLFTLKMFKQADFNNIANLNKDKVETNEHQKKVKESAKKHIKIAGGMFAGALALSALMVTRGKNSKALRSIGETILAPGSKLFKNNEKRANFVNKYFGLDFAQKNGKLAISRGQITACVTAGFFGYTGAAKDRGKQDYKEVLYRFPLVGLYAIAGSELIEGGLKKVLQKKEAYKNVIDKDLKVPKLSELPKIAEKLAAKNNTTVETEFKKLFKQKSTIVMAPFLFSLGFMGFFVAGMSRAFTKYRYEKDQEMLKAQGVKA